MKKIALIVLLVIGLVILSSCGNRQVGIDSHQTFDRAYVLLKGEWKEIQVKAWRDFENSDVVQVIDQNGTVYLTHYMNMVLVGK